MAGTRNKALGDYLKSLRLGAELTQEEAAGKAGLSTIFISLIENGRQTPSVRSLAKLAQAYGAALPELLEKFGYPANAVTLQPQRRLGTASRLSERRIDWALAAIASDYEYALAPQWETWPYVAKALQVRLYQSETGRLLLRSDETAALNRLIHGSHDSTDADYPEGRES